LSQFTTQTETESIKTERKLTERGQKCPFSDKRRVTMPKCMYRSESDNKCCGSTSNHHCQIVNDEICSKCLLCQETPDISRPELLKTAIRKALELLPNSIHTCEAETILLDALKI